MPVDDRLGGVVVVVEPGADIVASISLIAALALGDPRFELLDRACAGVLGLAYLAAASASCRFSRRRRTGCGRLPSTACAAAGGCALALRLRRGRRRAAGARARLGGRGLAGRGGFALLPAPEELLVVARIDAARRRRRCR